MIYDSIIVGTGPAGVSAALNLKIRDKAFVWIGAKNLSDKASRAERISNYPGLADVSGAQLIAAFRAQTSAMGIEIVDEMVNNIIRFSDHYALSAGSEYYETRTIILATGTANTAAVPGESRLLGRGVSYCATCDGNLYRGKTIAVVCTNARFEHEVRFLADLAAEVLFFPSYAGAFRAENVKCFSSKPAEICGEKKVEAIRLKDGSVFPVDGVFFLRDSVALSSLLPQLETEDGHIRVDRQMTTNLPGIFAAGDCTGRPYQYAKAVGEGNTAAFGVLEYLAAEGEK